MDLLVFSHLRPILSSILIDTDLLAFVSSTQFVIFRTSEAGPICTIPLDTNKYSPVNMLVASINRQSQDIQHLVSIQGKMGINLILKFYESRNKIQVIGQYATQVFGFTPMITLSHFDGLCNEKLEKSALLHFQQSIWGIRQELGQIAAFDIKSGNILNRWVFDNIKDTTAITSYQISYIAEIDQLWLITAQQGWKLSKYHIKMDEKQNKQLSANTRLTLPCEKQQIQIILQIVKVGRYLYINVRQDPNIYIVDGDKDLVLLKKVDTKMKKLRNLTAMQKILLWSEGGTIWKAKIEQKDIKQGMVDIRLDIKLAGELKQSKTINRISCKDYVIGGSTQERQIFHLEFS